MARDGVLRVRLAAAGDLAALRELIPSSVRALGRGYYTEAQIESSIRHMFGPDSQLIADGTYFVVEEEGRIVGCGGWSRRLTLYGGDQAKEGDDPLLDPAVDAARIRAFFVHPDHARRGVGSLLLRACVEAARTAGFRELALVATLPGEPLYRAFGFEPRERFDAPLADGTALPVVSMSREIPDAPL
ncbi:MAG TPA: GNAT family N-acetyltransferase [Myxococcota bacterium]|jgi:GNAT superfamily N-acetyltransferase|nr:GNAT family N-acetyltransferase [Myxococcota bacterium]